VLLLRHDGQNSRACTLLMKGSPRFSEGDHFATSWALKCVKRFSRLNENIGKTDQEIWEMAA
jgi:hypothetical protein